MYKRFILLVAALLLLPLANGAEAPLPGANTVSTPQLTQLPDGRWQASFEYFYTGAPDDMTILVRMRGVPKQVSNTPMVHVYGVQLARRGQHQVAVIVDRPADYGPVQGREISAVMRNSLNAEYMVSTPSPQVIDWPEYNEYLLDRQLAGKPPAAAIAEIAQKIDANQLADAKRLLERLLLKNPKVDAAYLELARIAMKSNWNAEGLQQAEALIGSAMQLRPDSVDARILLAYVYAYQRRFKESASLLEAASKSNPPNLWLWANWGDFYRLQDKRELAIAKYREAIKRPPTRDTYDRARQFSYIQLLDLLDERKDAAAVEALHRQRTEEYPGQHCYAAPYARLLLRQRGDAAAAQDVLTRLADDDCRRGDGREVLGQVHYMNWARSEGDAAADNLRLARVLAPSGPRLLYQLAKSEHTAVAARKLVAAGDRIDLQDKRQFDALSYALRDGDNAAARRLVGMGAKPDALVGPEKMPVALMPVLMRNFDGIRLMREAGVDYGKLQYQGMTALDHARSQNDQELLRALDPKGSASPRV